MRAIRYSSTLSAFNEERRSIKLMLLYNGYPTRYIYSRFMKFLTNQLTISSILPLIDNEHDFMFIRRYLLNRPTVIEHQIASRIATVMDIQNPDTIDTPVVQTRLNKNSKWIGGLIIHYEHEARLESYKKDIHQLWNKIFQETIVMNTKLIVGNRNSPNAKKTLVRRRSHHKSECITINNSHQP